MQTIGSLFNGMSKEQGAAVSVIFGAIAKNDDNVDATTRLGNTTLGAAYNSLSLVQKQAVSFLAGGIDSSLEHSVEEKVDEVLAHFGIKGMRWGVRNDPGTGGRKPTTKLSANVNRSDIMGARARVFKGNANLGDAHVAALRTTGERIKAGLLADKTFWKRAGIATAIGATGLAAGAGAALVAPAVLPAGFLAYLGGAGTTTVIATGAVTSTGVGGATAAAGGYGAAVTVTTPVAVAIASGASQLGSAIATTAVGGALAGIGSAAVSNVRRAVTGNSQINKSYETVGKKAHQHYTKGNASVTKVLKRNSGKQIDIKQSEFDVENFLEHFGIKGMRWGVRRKNPSATVAKTEPAVRPPLSTDYSNALATKAIVKTQGTQALSNQELQALITRMDLEKRYVAAVKTPSSLDKMKDAEKKISDILKAGGTLLKVKNAIKTKGASLVKDGGKNT